MTPLRLRHPKGVSTLQVDIDSSTVQDLQQQIFGVSEIPPSRQELRSGYPPQPLTLVPELHLSSLGIKAGEQIIVNQKLSQATSSQQSPATSNLVGSSTSSNYTAPPKLQAPPIVPRSAGPDNIETPNGFFVHRIVPDDNSCLFSSVALVFEQDISRAQRIREVVADGIRDDMETYNEAILGQTREQYISNILKPLTWGGAIELAVLAKHYNTEIASIDVETGRIDQFVPPPNQATGNRCVLIYSGIHYDVASMAPTPDAPAEWHQTVFPIVFANDEDPVLDAAQRLATILRGKKAFTNTATFDLKCEQCGQGLKGEKDARAHAQETGHVRFGEY